MKEKLKAKNGITLIALVITIIILIILAGVSISLVLGDNGIITRAKEAKSTYSQEAVREKVEMILAEYAAEEILENKDLDNYLNKKQEEGKIEEGSNNGDGTHTIILDGYEVKIKDDTLEIIEIIEESEFKKLTRGKARFNYTPQIKYTASVNVLIEIDESIKMCTVQYKIGNEEDASWIDYTEGEIFEVNNSGIIYGRIMNQETGEKGYQFTTNIDNIDDKAPQKAIIEISNTEVERNETIQATIKQEDKESGIDITNCKYIINQTENNIGLDSSDWNGAQTFVETPQTIEFSQGESGKYYIHVYSIDILGNGIETVSSCVEVLSGVTTYLETSAFGDVNSMPGWEMSQSVSNNELKVNHNSQAGAFLTEAADLTNIDSITLNYRIYFQGNQMPIHVALVIYSGDNPFSGIAGKTEVFNSNSGTCNQWYNSSITVDVSNLTGSYGLCVRVDAGNPNGGSGYVVIGGSASMYGLQSSR